MYNLNDLAASARREAPLATVAAPSNVSPLAPRRARRERDFGIGYGNSSGYASNKRYTSDWAQPRFRFA